MIFNFCPNCGKENSVNQISKTYYMCNHCNWQYWNNAKAATSIVLLQGDEMLYVKRKFDPDKGMYELPGGFVDYGEDLFESVLRELKEELGLVVKASDLHLLTAYSSEYMVGTSTIDLIIILSSWEGELIANDDVESLEWRPLSFIKDNSFIRPYYDLEEKIKAYRQL